MPSIDRLVLRVSIPVTVAVGIVAAVIGALVASDPGKALLGAAIGTVIVVAFFTVGQVVVGAVLRIVGDPPPKLSSAVRMPARGLRLWRGLRAGGAPRCCRSSSWCSSAMIRFRHCRWKR